MAVIIDAAAYFSYVKSAILRARHSILLIGWDFDTRVVLDRNGHDTVVPNQLGPLLSYVVRRHRELHVFVLRWDLAFLKMPFRGTTSFFLLELMSSRRLHLDLDTHHPVQSCHHQKIVVIDDAIAFCGGIDITTNRWDTPSHHDREPRRKRPNGKPHGPWHDVTTAVDGEAAQALGDLARARWLASTGQRLSPPPAARPSPWPDGMVAEFRDLDVGIARTEPAYDGQREVCEIEALYLAAIASARTTLYVESQYFSAARVSQALETQLAEPAGPEIVIINPRRAEGWLEEEVMGSARALLLERMRKADRYGRLRFYTPVTENGADIYVHAKVLVVDDSLLRVGSSNINNRSLGVDTECDLAVEVRHGNPNAEQLRHAIRDVRDALLSEHLGVEREVLRQTIEEAGGSLVRALDRLVRPGGRTLLPFVPPSLSDAERELAETHALDPRRPEPMAKAFVRTLRIVTPGRGVTLALAVLALGCAAFAWYRRRT